MFIFKNKKNKKEEDESEFRRVARLSKKKAREIDEMKIKSAAQEPDIFSTTDYYSYQDRNGFIVNKDESIVYVMQAYKYYLPREIHMPGTDLDAPLKGLDLCIINKDIFYIGKYNYYGKWDGWPDNLIVEDIKIEINVVDGRKIRTYICSFSKNRRIEEMENKNEILQILRNLICVRVKGKMQVQYDGKEIV